MESNVRLPQVYFMRKVVLEVLARVEQTQYTILMFGTKLVVCETNACTNMKMPSLLRVHLHKQPWISRCLL
jgi:hypothetical protein